MVFTRIPYVFIHLELIFIFTESFNRPRLFLLIEIKSRRRSQPLIPLFYYLPMHLKMLINCDIRRYDHFPILLHFLLILGYMVFQLIVFFVVVAAEELGF